MQITLYINMYHLRSQFLHSTIVYSLEVEHCISFSRASRPGRNTPPAIYKIYYNLLLFHQGPCGLMDKASASGAGDCGFESHQGRYFFFGAPRPPILLLSSLHRAHVQSRPYNKRLLLTVYYYIK